MSALVSGSSGESPNLASTRTDASNYFPDIPQVTVERVSSLHRQQSHHPSPATTPCKHTPAMNPSESFGDFLKLLASPQKLRFGVCPASSTTTTKFPFKSLPRNVTPITPSDVVSLHDAIIFDVRPFNVYSHSRIAKSINLCLPTTLLKRPGYDLKQILNSINIPAHDKQNILSQISLPTNPLKVLVYDAESSESQISFALHQTISKFLKFPDAFDIYVLIGGFNALGENLQAASLIEANEISSLNLTSPPSSVSSMSVSSNSPISPIHPTNSKSETLPEVENDHLPLLSGFTLPSAAPSQQKFLSSIKRNNLPKLDMSTIGKQNANMLQSCNQKKNYGIDSTLKVYHYKFKLPHNIREKMDKLPKWMKFLVENIDDEDFNQRLITKLNAKFLKIEECEQLRLNYAINNDGSLSASGRKSKNARSPLLAFKHDLAVCSPSALCPGCDETSYKIPKGIEYGFKNRYNNIWPYEHSRVKLIASPSVSNKTSNLDEEFDDYFNANYIAFPDLSDNKYIATQNPLQSTFEDFWKIVWYNKIPVIVCLNYQASILSQVPRYFDDQSFSGSKISIKTEESVDGKNFVLRTIRLSKANHEPVLVYHFEYKDWPDFGIPSLFDSIFNLIQSNNDIMTSNKLDPNFMVHCSAGCGRTGCFITLSMIIDNFENKYNRKDHFDPWGEDDLIYKSVQFQRTQRISMVQNLDQFIFCYEIILDYVVNNLI